jgi:H+/Cl- antiporter ClcA
VKMKARGDFAADGRLLLLSAIAVFIGVVCAFVAVLLLSMIAFFTNLFYYHEFSLSSRGPAGSPLGLWMILVPVLGGLIIGLMARYGSERIRGHGIPEALEAILFGKSIMQPKVAVLKPLSSAISIGSGGPFGAEGPIIMTGGALGSIVAQRFHLTAAERKTLLVSWNCCFSNGNPGAWCRSRSPARSPPRYGRIFSGRALFFPSPPTAPWNGRASWPPSPSV